MSISKKVKAIGVIINLVAPLLKDTSTALFFDDPQAGKKFFST